MTIKSHRFMKSIRALVLLLLLSGFTLPANCQSADEINQFFNQSDDPTTWSQMPAPSPTQAPLTQMPSQPIAPPMNRPPIPGFSNSLSNGRRMLQNFFGNHGTTSAPGTQLPQMPFNLSKRDVLRVLFGGTAGGSSANPVAVNGARENLQVASDQAAQAEDAATRANSGSDKGARQSAAWEAQDHANAARSAADRATSSAQGGSLEANDAAAQARNEADRAQAAADRAAANANGGGW